jgi:hypothetical protein
MSYKTVKSSNVEGYEYFPATSTLLVVYAGGQGYAYEAFPAEKFEALEAELGRGGSAGRAIGAAKSGYEFRKVGINDLAELRRAEEATDA